MLTVSIVIRTFNEEKWIRHCLEACEDQITNFKVEVVIIDTGSSDLTLKIIEEKGYKYLEYKDKYIPGRVLNKAINSNNSDFYVILSSHCIPTNNNWIQNLINPLIKDEKIAGVFGRQIPLPNSEDIDKRDLLMTFGCESRYQYKDPFFHNANSALRGKLIKETNFCERQKNAEDRIWAKEMLSKGYCIYYESEAKVFHHHGLHQGSPPERVSGVLSSIKRSSDENIDFFPQSMTVGRVRISFIILIPEYIKVDLNRLNKIIENIKEYIGKKGNILIISEEKLNLESVINVKRSNFKTEKDQSLSDLIFESCHLIMNEKCTQDFFIYLNYSYLEISKKNIDKLIYFMLNSNYDMCTFAVETYEHIWYLTKKEKFTNIRYIPVETKLLSSEYRNSPFKALYGLGSIFNLKALRERNFPANLTGLVQPEKSTNLLRHRNDGIY
tara:strand:- start:39053 stop:40375 length:1323 start_codon:yes stop_codon:yes gene_type:complete